MFAGRRERCTEERKKALLQGQRRGEQREHEGAPSGAGGEGMASAGYSTRRP